MAVTDFGLLGEGVKFLRGGFAGRNNMANSQTASKIAPKAKGFDFGAAIDATSFGQEARANEASIGRTQADANRLQQLGRSTSTQTDQLIKQDRRMSRPVDVDDAIRRFGLEPDSDEGKFMKKIAESKIDPDTNVIQERDMIDLMRDFQENKVLQDEFFQVRLKSKRINADKARGTFEDMLTKEAEKMKTKVPKTPEEIQDFIATSRNLKLSTAFINLQQAQDEKQDVLNKMGLVRDGQAGTPKGIQLVTDQFGNVRRFNKFTGEELPINELGDKPKTDSEQQFEAPKTSLTDVRVTEEDIKKATGPVSIIQQKANNVLGILFPGETIFPDTQKARTKVKILNRRLKETMLISKMGSTREQERLMKLIPDVDKFFKDPDGALIDYKTFKDEISAVNQAKILTLNSANLSKKERGDLISEVNNANILLSMFPDFDSQVSGPVISLEDAQIMEIGQLKAKIQRPNGQINEELLDSLPSDVIRVILERTNQ